MRDTLFEKSLEQRRRVRCSAGIEAQRKIEEMLVPRGDKSKYTDKQERKADHIAEGYERRGVPEKEAERRAWATVNKESGGGKKSGSGRGKPENHSAAKKGGRLGGRAAAKRSLEQRAASARKAAATRKRNAEHRAHAR
jgi:plasmid stabilization system protein ParE